MAKGLKIFRCDWLEDDGTECGELYRGRAQYDYHLNAHKRIAPKAEKTLAPTPRKVYHGG